MSSRPSIKKNQVRKQESVKFEELRIDDEEEELHAM